MNDELKHSDISEDDEDHYDIPELKKFPKEELESQ
jgi:hypothetical protein